MDRKPITVVTPDLATYLQYVLQRSDGPGRFARELASMHETSDESLWELLSLLDQYFRRGRIPAPYFRAARYAIYRRVLGLPSTEEREPPNPVVAVPSATESAGLSALCEAKHAALREGTPASPEHPIETVSVPTTTVDLTPVNLPQPAVLPPVSLQGPAPPSSRFHLVPPHARRFAAAALFFAVMLVVWSLMTRQSTSLKPPPEAAVPNVSTGEVAVVLAERAAETFASRTGSPNRKPEPTDDAAASEKPVAPDLTAPPSVPKPAAPDPTLIAFPVVAARTEAKSKLLARIARRPSLQCAEALLRASLSPRDTSAASSACQ